MNNDDTKLLAEAYNQVNNHNSDVPNNPNHNIPLNTELVQRIKFLVEEYIEEANEAEDRPLRSIEIARLRDFILSLEMRIEV